MWPVTTRDLLEELAQRHGVATSYASQSGFPVYVAEDTITYTPVSYTHLTLPTTPYV